MDEVNNIYETIYQIYLNNLNYLEKEFPEIFEKVAIVSTAIENGEYEEKYELQFDEKEGCFNIFDKTKNKFIYDGNSYDISDTITNETNYKGEGSTSLLEASKETQKLFASGITYDMKDMIEHINKGFSLDTFEYTKVFKYMFVGSGLGLHIDYINRKFRPNAFLIVEPNIEIFRLSLFVTDYSSLAINDQQIYLSVAEDRKERISTTDNFLKYQPYLNYVVKHTLFNDDYLNLLTDLASIIHNSHAGRFSYKVQMLGVKRTLQCDRDGYSYLGVGKVFKAKRLEGKPVLVLGGGPSVKKNIDWLKENQKKFYIIAVNTVIPYLCDHKINIDVMVAIDPNEIVAVHFHDEAVKKFYKDTAFVGPSQLSPNVLKQIKKENVFLFQAFLIDETQGMFANSPNVGAYALNLAILLGSKHIYCLGNDAAFDQESGELYARHAAGERKVDLEYKDFITVPGNFREKVRTNKQLLTFKSDYESSIKFLGTDPDLEIYNLSDGLFIEGMEPLKIEDMNMDEFKNLRKYKLTSFFEKHTTQFESMDFMEDQENIEHMMKLVKKFKKKKFANRDELIYDQLKLLLEIIELCKHMNLVVLGNLFLEFLKLSGMYLYFYLNIKGEHLRDVQKLSKMKILWCNVTLELLDDMDNINQDEEC